MSTYRELVYMVLDELKLSSDDASFTEEHVIFLLSKYRSMLIKHVYTDIRVPILDSNYQSIHLDLLNDDSIKGNINEGGYYLRSKYKVPTLMKVIKPTVTTLNDFDGNITYIDRARMKYIGYNKYLKNIIYATVGSDKYLYLTSFNKQFTHLEKVILTGVFEDPASLRDLLCPLDENGDKICDTMDMVFPIEANLIPQLIQYVVKELAGPTWKPEDGTNNSSDDLANLAYFISRNTKSNLQKEISE